MNDPINKAGNVFEGGTLLVAQADPKCWVREGYTVVKSSELEQLRTELEQAKIENKLQALEYITLFGEMQTLLERGEV